ncbi:hypothetical protein V6Z12_D04G155500 [Gossypium hirsutum]
MAKKKAFTPLLYLASIVFLPCLKSWITNWWDTRQSETFLNDFQENSILEQFIELHNEDHIHMILRFSTNLIYFVILSDFGFAHNDEIISGLVSTFPVILDTIFKYWIFRYLNRESPSLVVIYHSMND